jgi:hypothetical protein
MDGSASTDPQLKDDGEPASPSPDPDPASAELRGRRPELVAVRVVYRGPAGTTTTPERTDYERPRVETVARAVV